MKISKYPSESEVKSLLIRPTKDIYEIEVKVLPILNPHVAGEVMHPK